MPRTDKCLAPNKHVEHVREDCRGSTDHSLFTCNSNYYGAVYIVLIIVGLGYHGKAGPLKRYFTGLWAQ